MQSDNNNSVKKYNCGWGYTSMCNLRCKHCYNASGAQSRDSREIPFEKCTAIVEKLHANGVESINYGTGECGLEKDFWKLVELVHSKGIVQGITTNGWSVNNETISYIKQYMNDIDVSIDYPDKKQHNDFRGGRDAWGWAMNAISLLKRYDIDFSIVTCIHALNCNKSVVDDFIKFMKEHGCAWRINWFRPTGRGANNALLKLIPTEVYKVFSYIVENLKILALPDPYFAAMLGIDVDSCPCGSRAFRITPTGCVVPCVYFTNEADGLSIVDTEFDRIMNSRMFRTFQARKPELCENCEYKKRCNGGCASRAYLEYGDLNAPDSLCHKANGIEKNPFANLHHRVVVDRKKQMVHENYLCTAIFDLK